MLYSFKTVMSLLVSTILFQSCYTKAYPDIKLTIDPNFLSLFYGVAQKDTIRFNSSNGKFKTFFISKRDSVISNKKGWFINDKPYKRLSIKFREIGTDTTILERESQLDVGKDPEFLVSGITIQFNNLYFGDTTLPLLHHDTLIINNKKFLDYYVFETSLRLKNADDVKVLYINASKGILGFKTESEEIWVNEIE
jgi:hypothetical protein